MKTVGTDGRTYILNPSKDSRECEDENRSTLHLKAREILKKNFPHSATYEEVTLMGCKGIGGAPLTADFYIPDLGIIVEVHGAQHYKFNKHFFKTEAEFRSAQQNDEIKKEWAELNDLVFIELPYNEVKNWGKIINEAL